MKTSGHSGAIQTITSDEMRALEQEAIGSGRVTGLHLMERAGEGVVEAIFEEWPELAGGGHRSVVLCGPGNNGGDGFVVARLLKDAGWEVAVFLLGDVANLPPDARVNCERWAASGDIAEMGQASQMDFTRCDLVVDALFGIGLSRPITAPVLCALFNTISLADHPKRVAIDVPSGLDSDTGRPPDSGATLLADLTVTFHSRKPCHVRQSGADLTGKTVVKDIGL